MKSSPRHAGSVAIGSAEPPIRSDGERQGVGVLIVSGGAGIAPVSVAERIEIGLVEAVLDPDRSFHRVTYLRSPSTSAVNKSTATY